MSGKKANIDRRDFIKAGVGTAAGLAALGSGVASESAAAPTAGGMAATELPRAGRKLPIFGLGTATLMPQYNPTPDADKVALIRYAYDHGVRYFDTAAVYRTESYVGEALKDVRDDVYIATKAWPVNAAATRQQVEASFKSLQTDVIDCLKVHLAADVEVSLKVLDVLEEYKAKGRVRHIGMSNHVFFETAYALIDSGRLDEFLCARGYFPKGETEIISTRNAEVREMCISRAHELGMNIIGMKAMGGFMYGKMHGLWVPDFEPAKAEALPAAAIRWCFSDPRFHVYIIGAVIPEDIDANVATCSGDLGLTNDDRMVLADFSARTWQGEAVKHCPTPFVEAGEFDEAKNNEGRKKVMEMVGAYGAKVWADYS
jgi:aryl-alcohol dehydrogenase-like predicted oxidoreductase